MRQYHSIDQTTFNGKYDTSRQLTYDKPSSKNIVSISAPENKCTPNNSTGQRFPLPYQLYNFSEKTNQVKLKFINKSLNFRIQTLDEPNNDDHQYFRKIPLVNIFHQGQKYCRNSNFKTLKIINCKKLRVMSARETSRKSSIQQNIKSPIVYKKTPIKATPKLIQKLAQQKKPENVNQMHVQTKKLTNKPIKAVNKKTPKTSHHCSILFQTILTEKQDNLRPKRVAIRKKSQFISPW